MEFTKDSVIKAIDMLNTANFEEADNYLDSFQKSNEAWLIAEEILSHRPHHEMHILTFAAISLAKKIKYSFHLLGRSELSSLKYCLVDHLINASMIPDSKPLIVQLGVCLSVLGLMTSEWDHELQSFVQRLSGRAEHVVALLEVLKVLPEETRPSNLPLSGSHLNCVFHELRLQSSYVLNVLEELLERTDLPSCCLSKCLAVCGSWTKFGLVSPDQVLERKLFQRAHVILAASLDEGHSEAADCIVAMLEQSLVSNNLDNRLAQMVVGLQPAFNRSLNNIQLLQNYCYIFVNLFKTHFQLTKRDPTKIQERLTTIELLLLIAEKCPLELVETSLDMWYLLSGDNQVDPNSNSLYKPYFMRLLNLLFPRSRLPASYESILPPEPDSLDIHRFRGVMAELLVDVAHLVDVETMEMLYNIVRNEQSPWEDVEVALFFLRHLMGQFKERQTQMILNILDSVKDRQQAFIRLQVLELISIPETVDITTIWNCLVRELQRDFPMLAAIESRLKLLMPQCDYFIVLATMVDEFCLVESDRCRLLAHVCALIRQLPQSDIYEVKKHMLNIQWKDCPDYVRENRIKVLQAI
ncbi:transportin-3 isoform X1 [Drosophila takahashii]|uniref:transportin-3 isoform X1 n=1 Tax=Drosophila takahashii TaxID=29030 RepID=UPI00389933C8